MTIKHKKVIGVVLIIIALFFLLKIGLGGLLGHFFSPLLSSFNQQGLKLNSFLTAYSQKKNLLSEINQLKQQVADYQKEIVSLRSDEQKSALVEKYLQFLNQQKQTFILANIIGESYESEINYFIIDRGSDDKIKEGAALVVDDGYLAGKIVRVDKKYAYFLPIYDNHFLTSVDFLTNKPSTQLISGLAQGKHGINLEINFVPLDRNIKPGDYVITSGLEKNIPRGLIVGQVENVEKKPNKAFQNTFIKPLISLGDLRVVAVLINDNF